MTRERAAAMERAVSAYRRLIRVNIHNTAMELIADAIAYHQEFVSGALSDEGVDQLLADAKRRFSTLGEEERESEARHEDMYAQPDEATRAAQTARLSDLLNSMGQQPQNPMYNFTYSNTNATDWSNLSMEEPHGESDE